jgi:hypothetical protein
MAVTSAATVDLTNSTKRAFAARVVPLALVDCANRTSTAFVAGSGLTDEMVLPTESIFN